MKVVTMPNLFGNDSTSTPVFRAATISKCGLYRYDLIRIWNPHGPRACFVMLNPSTADAETDDPTLRKCMTFARAWGYGSLIVVNLFALRATDPRDLKKAADPIGPENDAYLYRAIAQSDLLVMAWGNRGALYGRDKWLRSQFPRFADDAYRHIDGRRFEPKCLGMTGAGQPNHPLYLASDTPLIPFASMEQTIKMNPQDTVHIFPPNQPITVDTGLNLDVEIATRLFGQTVAYYPNMKPGTYNFLFWTGDIVGNTIPNAEPVYPLPKFTQWHRDAALVTNKLKHMGFLVAVKEMPDGKYFRHDMTGADVDGVSVVVEVLPMDGPRYRPFKGLGDYAPKVICKAALNLCDYRDRYGETNEP